MVEDHFWKTPFLTQFGPIFGPRTAHFQGILAFSIGQNACSRAQNGLNRLVRALRMVEDHFWKNVFLTHF